MYKKLSDQLVNSKKMCRNKVSHNHTDLNNISPIKTSTTKNRILLFFTVSLALFTTVLLTLIYFEQKEHIENAQKKYYENATQSYQCILKENETSYKTRLEEILSSKTVLKAIANKDRESLYKELENRWNILKKENKNLKVLHFHLPDGKTLLRMHKPAKYGDNIAQKRPMVAYMHKAQKDLSGFEPGIHILAYRIFMPVFHKNEYIGAVEFGLSPQIILERMKEYSNLSGLMFSKELGVVEEKYRDKTKPKINNYTLEHSTLNDKKLVELIPSDYSMNNNILLKHGDKTYAVYCFDHINFEGKLNVKTLLFNDITDIKTNFNKTVKRVLALSLFLFIVFLCAIKLGFEKILSRMDKATLALEKNIAFLNSYQLAMDESSIVSKGDLYGRITYVNEKFCEVSGYSKEEALGKPHNILRHPETKSETFKELWETIQAKKVWKGILQNRGKNGDYWVDIAILPILDEKQNIVEYIAIRHEITQMIKQQEALDNIANTDALTGLGSRYKLNQDIQKSSKPAIAIFNVDNFSQLNDFYGHKTGDKIIQKIAHQISDKLMKEKYELYHLQGDEFVVLNSDAVKDEFVSEMRRLNKAINNKSIKIKDELLSLNFTTAISAEDKKTLLITADMALKVARKERLQLCVYSSDISLNSEYENNIKWTKKLKKALAEDKIIPVFQPIVNNANGKWEKYEALVRMEDDDNRLVAPFFFLDIAKKTKQYSRITKRIIEKSFDTFNNNDKEFSINLTIEDFCNSEIKNYIFKMLNLYGISKRVVFEIVESEAIENFDEIVAVIEKLKGLGCKIAIDDFGTGYSNFEYLMKLKTDYIKIDGSMIKNIDTNRDAQIVVATIVDFAKRMGIKTIAEFVANESIASKVKELEIDYSQGYFYSEPQKKLLEKPV